MSDQGSARQSLDADRSEPIPNPREELKTTVADESDYNELAEVAFNAVWDNDHISSEWRTTWEAELSSDGPYWSRIQNAYAIADAVLAAGWVNLSRLATDPDVIERVARLTCEKHTEHDTDRSWDLAYDGVRTAYRDGARNGMRILLAAAAPQTREETT